LRGNAVSVTETFNARVVDGNVSIDAWPRPTVTPLSRPHVSLL
jgi:hypothetical protein